MQEHEVSGPDACIGEVTSVNAGQATILLTPVSACETCKSKGSCALAPDGKQEMHVPKDALSVGDKVRVIVDPKSRLNTAAVLYLIPVLLIISGSFAGYFALPTFTGINSNLGSLVGVVTGILISYAFIHFYGGNQPSDQGIRIERIDE